MKLHTVVLLSALFSARMTSHAASLGDPAPQVTISQWIKGQPMKIQPGTNIFVIECWATWCGPCKRSIPHLTDLQTKYGPRGVTIIGISDEPAATVAPFVAGQGNTMNYHVAVDPAGRTLAAFTGAYGKKGIPRAYVIKDGRMLWHGNPMNGLDEVLGKIVEGKYDVDYEQNLDDGDRLVKQYTALASKTADTSKTAALGEKILSDYSRSWKIPYRLSKAILTEPTIRGRDLDLAMKAATQATEMTQRHSYQSLEMLARVQFATGRKQEAIATQREALGLCKDSEDRVELEKFLALFEKSLK